MGIFDDIFGNTLKDFGVTGSFQGGGSTYEQDTRSYSGVPGVPYPFLGGYSELYGSPATTQYPGYGSPFGGQGLWPEQPAPKPAYQANPDMVPISAINEYYDVFGPTVRADVNRMFGDRTEIPYQEALDRLGNPFDDASPESIGLMQGAAGYLGRRRQLINSSNTAGGYTWNAESGQWDLDPDSPAAQRGPKLPSQGLMDQLQGGTASGMSWNAGNGKWDRVSGGVPELVVDPETQTVFYRGIALTDQQYSQLVMNGPTSAPGKAIIQDALGTVQRGIDWERGQQGPQVAASYTGQTPSRTAGLALPGRQDIPFIQQMQQLLQDQGYLPTGMGPESDVDIERMPQISVDDARFREIDFQPDQRMMQGMIQGRVAYTEPLIKELRDEELRKYNATIRKGGHEGTAVAVQGFRDVTKPFNDRIIANRQQAVGQAIEQWYGAAERVKTQDAANWLTTELANQKMSFDVQVKNVGFLAQIAISEAELSARLRGQFGPAALQAATARRGQTIAGLQNLQNLIAQSGISQRGQDISAQLQARGQDVTQRGQDIQAAQEAGRQGLTAQQSNLDSWLRVLGIDSTIAAEQTRLDLTLFGELMQDSRFDRSQALEAWSIAEANKLRLLAMIGDIGRRTYNESSSTREGQSGFGLDFGSKKKSSPSQSTSGRFIPPVITRGGNGNGGGEDVFEGPTDNEGEIGPDPWPNSGPTVGAGLYPWDSPKSGREPPWFDPAQLEWGPNMDESYPPWHQPLGDDAERGPDGRVTRSASGRFTREKAISQYPPATLSDVPRLDPKFFENNPYPFGVQENDGSPPAGYTIPELQFLPTPGINVGYVAMSRDYLNNYSEFQQRNILHALRFRKAANGQIHGHQRMGSGAPTGYPGGFLTWPWYEQDRFVYEDGRQAHTSGPGLPGGLGSMGMGGGSGAKYGQPGGRTAGMPAGARGDGQGGFSSSAGLANPHAGTAPGGGGAGGICWVAAELYGWYTPDWYAARHFMVDVWQGKAADKFRAAYLKHGPQWAEEIRRNRTLRTKAKGLFDKFVRLGREHEE